MPNTPFAQDIIPDHITAWSFAGIAGGVINNAEFDIVAAAAATIKRLVDSVQVVNSHATVATEFVIKDGAGGTVLWRTFLPPQPAAGAANPPVCANFVPPLRGTAATKLVGQCVTTGAAVYFNCQGHTAN